MLLREGLANEDVQKARIKYHSQRLAMTHEELKARGEQINELVPWIDILACLNL